MIIKKSQIFLFDLILAFVILVVSLGLFYSYYVQIDENDNIYSLNVDILERFTNTKINNLNDEGIRDLFVSNKIQNVENTVAKQVVEFYEDDKVNAADAKDLTEIFIKDFIDRRMNFNLSLEDKTSGDIVVLYSYPDNPLVSFENAAIASSSQRQILGFRNRTDDYRPYLFRVKIWQ